MKLASLNQGRDGLLIVVSRDLTRAVEAPAIAATLQAALDRWADCRPRLEALYQRLNDGLCSDAFAFEQSACHSPLPRAYHWADGSAYVNHVELVRKARGAEIPESFWHDPLMYQGGADCFIPPQAPIRMADEAWGIDLEAEIAVITDDVPMGVTAAEAAQHIQLLMLVNDVSLRNLIPGELAKGFGFYQSKPSSSFSPVAITPDELGDCWKDGKVHRPLVSHINGKLFGQPDAGTDMTFNFPTLLAHAAKTRPLGSGSIIGSGTVSNYDRSAGSSCLAEKRMLEIIEQGEAQTPFLQFGDRVRIEMFDAAGHSLFGAIDQAVEKYAP
ncbi:fumarylacetoacetate hydrolase family protein [Pseudomonas sp. SA3-5]|uniref:Fumarylacetoacetate hydrolase family protein n=1 Tax=Pseudomonas aestuarii TaxID=3018340 RepID=A0ABT4XJF3_9PSED|nr:fumarylacetoacetate hydrolase family protein [Pseudomonas aestuarii]MDA7088334.1 fumarylacetoacetate hydrolase family protein [Pseudomonas aestuarii]